MRLEWRSSFVAYGLQVGNLDEGNAPTFNNLVSMLTVKERNLMEESGRKPVEYDEQLLYSSSGQGMDGYHSGQYHNERRSQSNAADRSHGKWNESIGARHPARGHQRGIEKQSGCWYCRKQGHVQADCPTKQQSHEKNGSCQHTDYAVCCSRRDSREASGRKHDSAQMV